MYKKLTPQACIKSAVLNENENDSMLNTRFRMCHLDQQSDTSSGDGTEDTSTDQLRGTSLGRRGGTVRAVGGVGTVSGVGGGNSGGSGQSDDDGFELHFG